MTTLEDKVNDLPRMTSAFALLGGLSKYADIAATAVMRGRKAVQSFDGFMQELETIYPALREQIISTLTDDEDRAMASAHMRVLPNDQDVLRASLVLDQAHTYVQSIITSNSMATQLRVSSMRLEMEEKSAIEEMTANQGRANHSKVGNYV